MPYFGRTQFLNPAPKYRNAQLFTHSRVSLRERGKRKIIQPVNRASQPG
ncbi:hypothetical protein CI1B_29300 [Bradyrhizobium ivorense]|uniref:Uncharacterized protein n=1 Tax=Bradyrhizobium ivorense TaxID=2511166 RepID=A0A508TA24_9BRAD|nr:hypothetical protein CI1B_29300 [Bradyrhizobium ivorense]